MCEGLMHFYAHSRRDRVGVNVGWVFVVGCPSVDDVEHGD